MYILDVQGDYASLAPLFWTIVSVGLVATWLVGAYLYRRRYRLRFISLAVMILICLALLTATLTTYWVAWLQMKPQAIEVEGGTIFIDPPWLLPFLLPSAFLLLVGWVAWAVWLVRSLGKKEEMEAYPNP